MVTLTGSMTYACETDEEYFALLDQVTHEPTFTVTSADASARTISFDVGVSGDVSGGG